MPACSAYWPSTCLAFRAGARAEHEGSDNLDCRLGNAFAWIQCTNLVLGGTRESFGVSDRLPDRPRKR
jgi:hypothetical protein